MWLFIEPSDVWLFRDGKPFDAGSDHRARTLFPPNPTTVQGAIRSKLLAASGTSLVAFALRDPACQTIADQIGWPGEPPPFSLRGPLVARCERDETGKITGVRRYFPLPADVVKVKGTEQYRVLEPLNGDPFAANWPQDGLLPLWAWTTDVLTDASGWIDEETLVAYLRGAAALSGTDVLSEEALFARESRFGIGLDSRVKRPEEGLLYQIEFARLRENVGLLVEVDDSHLPTKVQLPADGPLSIGGESRAAHYTILDSFTPVANPWPALAHDGKTRLKLYLASPTWFAGGWRAADWENWLKGQNLRLVAAAIRRAQPIGGVRVDAMSQAALDPRPVPRVQHGHFQKAMSRYVPAGSVYFFEADGPITYTSEPVTEEIDAKQIGFGHVLAGTWNYVKV